MAERPVEDIFAAPDEPVVVPGTDAAALIVPHLARSLTAVLDDRKVQATRIEELLDSPLSEVLTSMPGIGVRTGARILVDVDDSFATAGHLAAYAGFARRPAVPGPRCAVRNPRRR